MEGSTFEIKWANEVTRGRTRIVAASWDDALKWAKEHIDAKLLGIKLLWRLE